MNNKFDYVLHLDFALRSLCVAIRLYTINYSSKLAQDVLQIAIRHRSDKQNAHATPTPKQIPQIFWSFVS